MSIDLSGGGNIGGKSFASLGLLLTKVNIPILPDTRQVEEELPGVDGTIDLETRFGARPIELTFELIEDFEIDFHIRLSEIAAAFNPLKGQQILMLERNPGKQWKVKYNGSLPIDRLATIGTFTVPLKAFFPFAESVNPADTELKLGEGLIIGMGYEISDTIPTFNIKSSPTTITVKNAGNHEARPVITLSGTGSGIKVTNKTTGESFSFNEPLSGGNLVINTALYTAEHNSLNVFHLVLGDFPQLVEGNNVFIVTATNPSFTIDFDFRHTYLY
ncbi:phage tail domain-containing protein [Schinkia azotoformans]|uniref:phage tail domain-containing protein n=1 Tax=Schinkia azotoformans TaxID=1454 RepID=UPI002DB91057|nr:phage tail domain-containing protein [Schinkia azotoformans]MEC1714765.1 phage tail family protein [Schinkia azotoformans]MEC1757479.1 phage tail family protein [Schinkia azotoformans]